MKKLWVLLSVGVLTLGIAGCGNPADKESGQQSDGQQESVQPDSGAAGGTDAGQSSAGDGQIAGTVASGHDYEDGWTEEMQGIKTAVTEALGEDYWPNMPLMPDELEAFVGVTPDMYEDYMAEMCAISTNVDTLIVVKAKEDQIQAVEEVLNAYRDMKVNDTMQYPMNIGKIQASRVERHGSYIYFVQLGADTMEAMEAGDEAVIVQCQEMNELVIEVLNKNIIEE